MKTDKVINLNKYRQTVSGKTQLPGKKTPDSTNSTVICLQTIKVRRRLV